MMISFEANGTNKSEETDDFFPTSFSTPTAVARLCGFSKSHYDGHSDIAQRIETNIPIQRPMAGRQKLNRIWDTHNDNGPGVTLPLYFMRVWVTLSCPE